MEEKIKQKISKDIQKIIVELNMLKAKVVSRKGLQQEYNNILYYLEQIRRDLE